MMDSALAYARSVQTGDTPLSWSDLERSAFHAHPDIQESLGQTNADLRSRPTGGLASGLLALGAGVIEIWPLIAAGIVLTAGRLGADLDVPLAVAGIGAIGYLVSRVILDVRVVRGQADVSATRALLNGVAVLFGALAVWATTIASRDTGLARVWVAVFVAMAVSSAATAVTMAVRVRRSGGASVPATRFDELRRAVDALAPGEKESIRSDLAQAVDILADAGVIDHDEAADAANAPLGGLARQEWARSQSSR